MKTCECGCGLPVPIATRTWAKRGWVTGQPMRFVVGHARRGVKEPHREPPLKERFWSRVNKHGPMHLVLKTRCWLWEGSYGTSGYGSIFYEGHTVGTHRIAWFLETGEWPDPFALHKCDAKPCVRFSHLFEGTHKDNMADMLAKGRGRWNQNRGGKQ